MAQVYRRQDQAPRLNTCGDTTLDFFVVSQDLAPAVIDVVLVKDALFNPHKPVRMYIQAAPRRMMVRQIKHIGKFPAVMPHGPEIQRTYPPLNENATKGEMFVTFTSRMEQELVDLSDLNSFQIKSFFGGRTVRCLFGGLLWMTKLALGNLRRCPGLGNARLCGLGTLAKLKT